MIGAAGSSQETENGFSSVLKEEAAAADCVNNSVAEGKSTSIGTVDMESGTGSDFDLERSLTTTGDNDLLFDDLSDECDCLDATDEDDDEDEVDVWRRFLRTGDTEEDDDEEEGEVYRFRELD